MARQQKGSASYGQFKLVSANDADFVRITSKMKRAEQTKALEDPEFYDDETEKLMLWFGEERKRREGTPRVNGKKTNGAPTVEA